MDITHVQNRNYGNYEKTPASFDEASFDQIFASAAASRAAEDDVHILPEPDTVRAQPISESETKLYDLERAILSGEYSREEILELVKTIGKNGKPHFKSINEQVIALAAVHLRISQDTPTNPALPTLAKATNGLLYLRDYNAEIIDSIVNPTLYNGGKNPFEVE